MKKLIEMKFTEKYEDILGMQSVILLKGVKTDHILRIWIGEPGSSYLNMITQDCLPTRPIFPVSTKNTIEACEGSVTKIIITDLVEVVKNSFVFFSDVEITMPNGEIKTVDFKPSNSIPLAILCNAPIYVNSEIFEKIPKDQWDPKGTGAIFIMPSKEETQVKTEKVDTSTGEALLILKGIKSDLLISINIDLYESMLIRLILEYPKTAKVYNISLEDIKKRMGEIHKVVLDWKNSQHFTFYFVSKTSEEMQKVEYSTAILLSVLYDLPIYVRRGGNEKK